MRNKNHSLIPETLKLVVHCRPHALGSNLAHANVNIFPIKLKRDLHFNNICWAEIKPLSQETLCKCKWEGEGRFSLYTDIVCFFFPSVLFENTGEKEKLFSSSPTPTPLYWRSINPPRFLFIIARALDELWKENKGSVKKLGHLRYRNKVLPSRIMVYKENLLFILAHLH